MCICSSNLRIGVKSQSNLVIAGSYRNRPKSSLSRDSWRGRATDLRTRGRNPSSSCPTPNFLTSKKLGNGDAGVNLHSKRGTTPTIVKVPK